MTIVGNREFAINQEKYFDLAIDEDVCIKRGEEMFHLTCSPVEEINVKGRVYYEPDEDFYRSITKEELLKGIHEDIHKMFATK